MFSSKTPRDLNRDPEWICGKCGGSAYEHSLTTSTCVWEPIDPKRPEFDHVPHNPVNRRLTLFRREVQLHREAGPEIGLSVPHLARLWIERNEFGSEVDDAEFNHSQRVLTRLAALS